jgi:hypothetical protein
MIFHATVGEMGQTTVHPPRSQSSRTRSACTKELSDVIAHEETRHSVVITLARVYNKTCREVEPEII